MDTQQLVIDSLPLAAHIAGNISKRLPPRVDPRDLRQEACLGLLDAARRYDAGKGVPFGAYARRRIRGAVMDGLRREDHLARAARAQARAEGAEVPVQSIQLTAPDQVVGGLTSPHEDTVDAERARLVADAIETLPARLRAVLRAYYWNGDFMTEIAGELGICSARVSHLHCDALGLLREYFEMRGFTSLAEVQS